jgi:hypothetical protein
MSVRSWLPAALLLCTVPLAGQGRPDRNAILVTLDGVRVQEFFGGLDTVISAAPEEQSGLEKADRIMAAYWRPTAEARRHAVMPFLWDSLVPNGVAYGDQARGRAYLRRLVAVGPDVRHAGPATVGPI